MTKRHYRSSKSRFCKWQVLSVSFCILVPVVAVAGLVSLRVLHADEGGRWMVSGKVIRGLSAESSRVPAAQFSGNKSSGKWMAEVAESPWQYMVIHHSASESGSVSSIHGEHRQRKDSAGNFWQGIGYHFVIGNGQGMKDGAVEPTFRWNEQIHGAHSGSAVFNARGIGICLIGNFENTPPTNAQMESVRELVKTLATRHRITRENLIGHASVKATACPGKHFPLKELRAVIPKSQS